MPSGAWKRHGAPQGRGTPRGRRPLPGDEAAAHALRPVRPDAAPERVADTLLELRGQAGAVADAQNARPPRLAAALDPEVVPVVAGIADDELDGARLWLGGEPD